MRYLLDTNICIYVIKKRPAHVFRRFDRSRLGDIGISAITYSELLYGVEKSQSASRNRTALEAFTAPLEILDYDESAAEAYGSVRAELERKGQPIGAMDLLIGAHCLAAGLVLVTNNAREFDRIPGLRIENWALEEGRT